MTRALIYLDLDILLERNGPDSYRARVVNAPAGQTASVAFSMPFKPLELENFILRIGRPRRIVRWATRRIDASETAAIKAFGGQLYRALFHDDLEVNLLRSMSEAAVKHAGLRIRLRLSDAPELAELPWEFLYDATRNRFLALSDRTPLVRFLEVPDPPRPLEVCPPLRILVMIASPSDHAQLDVEQEWTRLQTALGPLERTGQVEIMRLETASLAALRQQLRRADWHILHFIGHGGFDRQTEDGVLVLEDQQGRGRFVSGQDLGVLLHDHDPLRLVVLNACEGARGDVSDPFAGIAQSLIQQGIPAVVAMQFEITDNAAIVLANELYGAVADGYPLDAALTEARKALWADGNQIEWGTPVLYLRAQDGRIFNVTAGTPAASPPAPEKSTAAASAIAPPIGETPAHPLGDTEELEPVATDVRPEPYRSSTPLRMFQHPSKRGFLGLRSVRGVAFSPDARWLATASEDTTARIWDAHDGQQLQVFTHRSTMGDWAAAVQAVAFSPDGDRLATASADRTARIWDSRTGQQMHALIHADSLEAVGFSPHGRLLVTASQNTAQIWDAQSGLSLQTLTHERVRDWDAAVQDVAFSPDGDRLATASADRTARIWTNHSGQQSHILPHDDPVQAVAFSPDGRWLATASQNTARIWDVRSGEQLQTLCHQTTMRVWDATVYAVAFSPDGRWLASASRDKTARLWDTQTGEDLYTLTHDNWVRALAFSPDSGWLATGTRGNRAVLWVLEPSTRP